MSDRGRLIARFLDGAGWAGAARTPLAGDASFRRYERVRRDGGTAVLMDAPPPQEDVRPFLAVARHLRRLGYSAPEILAADENAGLLLLEDFGADTFTRLLEGGAEEAALYALAVDLLADLHRRPMDEAVPKDLPPYDDRRLLDEAALLVDWYLPAVSGAETPAALAAEYEACWRGVLPRARTVPDTLVLRDFHVDNLMRLSGRDGLAACGLLDFQDAVAGPLSYDLVSLLEDARRDIAPDLAAAMRARYLAAVPGLDEAALDESMVVLGAQRHCKVIGIFTRLSVRDGKPVYLEHIPRLWRLLEAALVHSALAPVRRWLDANVPPALRVVPPCRPAA